MDEATLRRFWKRVDKSPHPKGCWIWLQAGEPVIGYGLFWIGGKRHQAHRLSWELANGRAMPPHLFGCHRCDNPACINPEHVFPGTPLENMLDKIAKGRDNLPSGEEHWTKQYPNRVRRGEDLAQAKLTAADVIQMRKDYASGIRQSDLSARYHVSQPHVGYIVRGEIWRHVGGPVSPDNTERRSGRSVGRKIDAIDVREIRRRYATGEANQIELARQYCVAKSLISAVIRRRTWAYVV